jgi:hypothetical protein
LRQLSGFRALHTFNDAEVSFRAGSKGLKCFLVSGAFMCRQRDIITVEFDKDRSLLQSGFMGLNLTGGPSQKAPSE